MHASAARAIPPLLGRKAVPLLNGQAARPPTLPLAPVARAISYLNRNESSGLGFGRRFLEERRLRVGKR